LNDFDMAYFQGDQNRAGSDICRKYDSHWWAFRYYAGLVRKYCRTGTVLELGCAHGYLLSFLDPSQYRKLGKDLSRYALEHARTNNPTGTFFEGSVEEIPEIEKATVDVVVAKYVLEHLPHPERTLHECARVLRPKGTLIFSAPNTSSVLRAWKGDQWIGSRDPTHCSVLEPEKWKEQTEAAGFAVTRMFSDGFWDVPYVKWLPTWLQLPIFGWAAILQVLLCGQWIPVRKGENLIVVAKKPATEASLPR
jgi:SAM-dependent methyltransferase